MQGQSHSLKDSTFFKRHVLDEILQQSEIKPFEQFLPFDPSIIDAFSDDEICENPLITHVAIHYKQALFPSKYFQQEKFLNITEKGKIRIFEAMDPTKNNIILFKDFSIDEGKITAEDPFMELKLAIQRPVLPGNVKIRAIFSPYNQTGFSIFLEDSNLEISEYKFTQSPFQQNLQQHTPHIQDVLIEVFYTTLQIQQFHPLLQFQHRIYYVKIQQEYYFKSKLIIQSEHMDQPDKIHHYFKMLKFFHDTLHLSVGYIELNHCPSILLHLEGICSGSKQLYSFDIVNLIMKLLPGVQKQKQKHSAKMKTIIEAGEDIQIIHLFNKLFQELENEKQVQTAGNNEKL